MSQQDGLVIMTKYATSGDRTTPDFVAHVRPFLGKVACFEIGADRYFMSKSNIFCDSNRHLMKAIDENVLF